jgi:dsRNA-specific ribonuclease
LAELLESVFGAIVEDGGFDAIRVLAARVIGPGGESATCPFVDAKSALQIAALARQEKLEPIGSSRSAGPRITRRFELRSRSAAPMERFGWRRKAAAGKLPNRRPPAWPF